MFLCMVNVLCCNRLKIHVKERYNKGISKTKEDSNEMVFEYYRYILI